MKVDIFYGNESIAMDMEPRFIPQCDELIGFKKREKSLCLKIISRKVVYENNQCVKIELEALKISQ